MESLTHSRNLYSVSITLALLLASVSSSARGENCDVQFGRIEQHADGSRTLIGTNRLPVRSKASGFRFGVLLHCDPSPAGNDHYTEYLLPAPAVQLTGTLRALPNDPRRFRQTIRFDAGRWLGELHFHEDDPTGVWQVTVVIGGASQFRTAFEVYEE